MSITLRKLTDDLRREFSAAHRLDGQLVERDIAARRHEAAGGRLWADQRERIQRQLERLGVTENEWCKRELGCDIGTMRRRVQLAKGWDQYERNRRDEGSNGQFGLVYGLSLIRTQPDNCATTPHRLRTHSISDVPRLDTTKCQFITGDALAEIRKLKSGSVNTIITSPAYWPLKRTYGGGGIGYEATVTEYLANIVAVMRQARRVLKDTGTLLEAAEPWDLVILDEAHHARRRGAGSVSEGGPNALLRLMRNLKDRTQGLVLMTATPMQVHPVEVFDLLSLLGLPPEWTQQAFLRFFEEVLQDAPSHEVFDRLAAMFRAVELSYSPVDVAEVQRIGNGISGLKARKILSALRDKANIPRRQLETSERRTALHLMRLYTPMKRLVSRHTRELLRRYFKAGRLTTPIADRRVEDRFIDLSPAERTVYEAVEDYISTTYNQATAQQRNATGFVMTIYRRRLASSFFALGQTLEAHLLAVSNPGNRAPELDIDEGADSTDDGDEPDSEEAQRLQQEALVLEERSDIERLLAMLRRLPPDSKLQRLRNTISDLHAAGYRQVMVFTQFTDTMDFLRGQVGLGADLRIMCFSGRGGEIMSTDGSWRTIPRDDVKRRFRNGDADILLCTEAAAEGLNFQFCGSLINYDMPWNPMRVEQRIGRIDRLGQRYPEIRIVNLHYANTIEADVYAALRQRIGLFENVVGRLQPILARLPTLISGRVLEGRTKTRDDRQTTVNEIEIEATRVGQSGFDIDAVTDADIAEPPQAASPMTMADLDRVLSSTTLLPPGIEASPMGAREYRFQQPGLGRTIRISTDPAYYEQNADNVELWSPGNPTFPPTGGDEVGDISVGRLSDLLGQG